MNILYIGSSGALSIVPFKTLLATEHNIVAAGVQRPLILQQKIIALENESLALLAQQQSIPVIDFSQPLNDLLESLSEFNIDVIIMSCFSRRLPEEIVKLAAQGCFNMHPSLLPHYRGPEPIFWQMKDNSETGVSWHLVSEQLDAGDVVKQQAITLYDGLLFEEISELLAKAGAALLLSLLSDIEDKTLDKLPQDDSRASYYRYPETQDFVVDSTWTAQHAYNFMRATQAFSQQYRLKLGDTELLLEQALDYDNNMSLDVINVQGDRLYIPFNEGVLIASYTGKLM